MKIFLFQERKFLFLQINKSNIKNYIIIIYTNANSYRTGFFIAHYHTRFLLICFPWDSNILTYDYRMNALFPSPYGYDQQLGYRQKKKKYEDLIDHF